LWFLLLSIIWQAGQKLIPRLFAVREAELAAALRRARFERALLRLFDALLWIVGAAWLAQTWDLDLVNPAPGSIERLFVRPVLEAALTIAGAWILWTALSAIIDEKMPQAMGPGDEDERVTDQVSRVGTLLPLIRNVVLIGVAIVAIIVALSTLGLNVGPLLAGLGVVGIAVGFGAQTLVRDVISGILFLMEDAFRVGEYRCRLAQRYRRRDVVTLGSAASSKWPGSHDPIWPGSGGHQFQPRLVGCDIQSASSSYAANSPQRRAARRICSARRCAV